MVPTNADRLKPRTNDFDQPGAGPWSSAALTRAALNDLRAMAEVAHARGQHPDDTLHAVAKQASLWHRRGAEIDDQDVLRAVRGVLPDYQPYADLQHALIHDRIRDAIAAMQQEIAGSAYKDGYMDSHRETREAMVELIRKIVAAELPEALEALGVRIGGTL
jgi:hypothetical protein